MCISIYLYTQIHIHICTCTICINHTQYTHSSICTTTCARANSGGVTWQSLLRTPGCQTGRKMPASPARAGPRTSHGARCSEDRWRSQRIGFPWSRVRARLHASRAESGNQRQKHRDFLLWPLGVFASRLGCTLNHLAGRSLQEACDTFWAQLNCAKTCGCSKSGRVLDVENGTEAPTESVLRSSAKLPCQCRSKTPDPAKPCIP